MFKQGSLQGDVIFWRLHGALPRGSAGNTLRAVSVPMELYLEGLQGTSTHSVPYPKCKETHAPYPSISGVR